MPDPIDIPTFTIDADGNFNPPSRSRIEKEQVTFNLNNCTSATFYVSSKTSPAGDPSLFGKTSYLVSSSPELTLTILSGASNNSPYILSTSKSSGGDWTGSNGTLNVGRPTEGGGGDDK